MKDTHQPQARARVGFDGLRAIVMDMTPLAAVDFLLDMIGDLVGVLPDGRDIGWPDVHLSPSERAILQILVRNEGRLVSYEAILSSLYAHNSEQPEGNILKVFMSRMRPKLAGRGVRIATSYGVGWTLTRDPGVVFPWEQGV